ncbi:MAG: CPBP family intramembrane glutamate endopeptidase, partial [Chloroflexota bacterium]
FGLGHIPSAVALTGVTITPALIGAAIVLNASSLLFGWCYWYRGIVTAIVAHIALHVTYTLLPALLG